MIFKGMEPWTEREPLVEVRFGKRIFDLHNWATFVGFEFKFPETLTVSFDYDESEGGFREGATAKRLDLRFEGVADLRVERTEMDQAYEGDSLSDFIYHVLRPGRGLIQMTMMDGFTLSFEAGQVVLDHQHPSGAR